MGDTDQKVLSDVKPPLVCELDNRRFQFVGICFKVGEVSDSFQNLF